ncbi:MAG: cytidylate kinase-like family protein [Candidatus Omnitrophica bacterium]|nr:cytidylate kinase-like family protein [Candidatus Omnitrophota bacterium]MCA9427316.1 cytidylate kinase-like family protein [Candidatus Omnitrophota bacterium]MCA9430716.1 cytidylate kinase-like family protein [Candidatus Omnitrophota bacterium]MCA9434450.1 cytidylate kinase-like family protein [Candidatus Omnitrophota bacterium]MCA9439356.1 cytidylate kinase-like family protein [Candidatus Omnitrophota bacterium]
MKQISELVNSQMRQWELRRTHEKPHREEKVGPVICVSRDLGTGGRAVARDLAGRLALDIMGKDIIDSIAENLHQQRRMVDILDERGKVSLERWIDGYLHGAPVEYGEYAKGLMKVVRAAALHGNVLFLGRGANWVLGLDDAFCVRIVAPIERRIERVMGYLSVTRAEALEAIHEADQQRNEFVRKVFHRDPTDASGYHLTLNTGGFTEDKAVDLILEAMKMSGFSVKPVPVVAS